MRTWHTDSETCQLWDLHTNHTLSPNFSSSSGTFREWVPRDLQSCSEDFNRLQSYVLLYARCTLWARRQLLLPETPPFTLLVLGCLPLVISGQQRVSLNTPQMCYLSKWRYAICHIQKSRSIWVDSTEKPFGLSLNMFLMLTVTRDLWTFVIPFFIFKITLLS